MNTSYIRFDDDHVDAIESREKTSTIRYELERSFAVGDVVALVDEQGERFAEAEITDHVRVSAGEVVGIDFVGHTTYDTLDELTRELRQYYDLSDFDESTRLEFVAFEVKYFDWVPECVECGSNRTVVAGVVTRADRPPVECHECGVVFE